MQPTGFMNQSYEFGNFSAMFFSGDIGWVRHWKKFFSTYQFLLAVHNKAVSLSLYKWVLFIHSFRTHGFDLLRVSNLPRIHQVFQRQEPCSHCVQESLWDPWRCLKQSFSISGKILPELLEVVSGGTCWTPWHLPSTQQWDQEHDATNIGKKFGLVRRIPKHAFLHTKSPLVYPKPLINVCCVISGLTTQLTGIAAITSYY